MKVSIGSDHGGYELKLEVIEHLKKRGFEVTDVGTDSPASCDYPIYACGTGIGMSMAANKEPGIRAALCHDTFSAKATREHNDANILCMGARVVGPGLALMIIDTFLDTPFSNDERHIRRISMY